MSAESLDASSGWPTCAIGGHVFTWGARTYIMGILNLTPDSFSGDGLWGQADVIAAALQQAQQMLAEGADLLDLGGESTRPGAEPVSLQEELRRVLPVLRELRQITDAPICVDTSKAGVAEAALAAGADMINDVWSLHADPDLAAVVAAAAAPVVLMHNRSTPKAAQVDPTLGGRYVGVQYQDVIADIKRELGASLELAFAAGIAGERIILDPGIGFGKTVAQNLELLDRLGELRELGFPLLVGASRKSFIGYTLNLPAEQRSEGTAAATVVSIVRGTDIVRVHDVRINVLVARMTDAIVRRPAGQAAPLPSPGQA